MLLQNSVYPFQVHDGAILETSVREFDSFWVTWFTVSACRLLPVSLDLHEVRIRKMNGTGVFFFSQEGSHSLGSEWESAREERDVRLREEHVTAVKQWSPVQRNLRRQGAVPFDKISVCMSLGRIFFSCNPPIFI